MSTSIFRIFALFCLMFVGFFGIIAQINTLSVSNQESKFLNRDIVKLESQKESFSQDNATKLAQEIDKKLNQKTIQPLAIGESNKQIPLQETIKKQQKSLERPFFNSNMLVGR